jgi:hypothetical protein
MVQEQFSSEKEPSVWRVIPTYEALIRKWHTLSQNTRMAPLKSAYEAGILMLEKYYNKTENSAANIVSLCE